VATSALLDLVSESWLDRLASRSPPRDPLYAALSYADGRVSTIDPRDRPTSSPPERDSAHRQGFGPALRASAATFAIGGSKHSAYSVAHATSGLGDGTA